MVLLRKHFIRDFMTTDNTSSSASRNRKALPLTMFKHLIVCVFVVFLLLHDSLKWCMKVWWGLVFIDFARKMLFVENIKHTIYIYIYL